MENLTEQDRINQFSKIMDPFTPENFKNLLIENGFFSAPASTKFHGAYSGGLYDHSYTVMTELLNLTEKLGLTWEKERSPYFVGMFHDLCKINSYIKVGDEKWTFNKKSTRLGHGNKSVLQLKKYIPITEEEELCIRWHMGAFDDKENWNKYSDAIIRYPNVLYTHTADMIASKIRGI